MSFKRRSSEILKDIINYPEIEGILIDNENTVVLKYSPYKDVNNSIPEKIKKQIIILNKKKSKKQHIYI